MVMSKAWYIVQTKRDNQTEWWSLHAPIPVKDDGAFELACVNMDKQFEIDPDSQYRVIKREETVVAHTEEIYCGHE